MIAITEKKLRKGIILSTDMQHEHKVKANISQKNI